MTTSSRNKVIERRIFDADVTIRSNSDGSVGARGYGAVFDSEAHGEVVHDQLSIGRWSNETTSGSSSTTKGRRSPPLALEQ